MSAQCKTPTLRTELGKARGLGSAKSGTEHWWAQRLTSMGLVPLTLWFIVSMVSLAGADYAAVKAWLHSPLNATLAVLLVAVTFHHAAAGLEVIFEDYVQAKCAKVTVITFAKFLSLVLAVSCVVSILKLFVGG